jgi:hypothetical protein
VSDVVDLAPLLLEEMARMCGDQPMTSEELVIRIHSAQVPNMELVDLPGKKEDHRHTLYIYNIRTQ